MQRINLRIYKNIAKNITYGYHKMTTPTSDFIFCHIPKTGGMSISNLIGFDHVCKQQHCVCDKKNINKFLFTFVRHPYDRFLSAFFYLQNGGMNDKDKYDRDKYIGQSDVKHFLLYKLKYAIYEQQHFRPQNYWIPNGADFIGKYENLQNDFNELKNHINIPQQSTLPHLNKTQYSYSLSNIEKQMIYLIYQLDFELFNYNSNF